MGRKAKRKAFKAELAGGRSPLTTPYEQVTLGKYSPDQPRDDHGRWSSDGGSSGSGYDPAFHGPLTSDEQNFGGSHIPAGEHPAMATYRENRDAIVSALNADPGYRTRGMITLSHGPSLGNALADLRTAKDSELPGIFDRIKQRIEDNPQDLGSRSSLELSVGQRLGGAIATAVGFAPHGVSGAFGGRGGGGSTLSAAGLSQATNQYDYYHSDKAAKKAERAQFRAALARGGSKMTDPFEQVLAQKYDDSEPRDDHR